MAAQSEGPIYDTAVSHWQYLRVLQMIHNIKQQENIMLTGVQISRGKTQSGPVGI